MLCRLGTVLHRSSDDALCLKFALPAFPAFQCCSAKQAHSSKTGSRQAVCHCRYTCGALLFMQVCSDSTQVNSYCVRSITPMEICSSYRCAVTHHKCTAALFRARRITHCSVLLCKQSHSRQCVTAITLMET